MSLFLHDPAAKILALASDDGGSPRGPHGRRILKRPAQETARTCEAAGAQQGQGTRGPFARRGSNRLPRSHTASLRNVLENAFQQGFIGGISGRLTFKKREAKAKAMVQVPKSEKYENKRVNAALRKAQEKRDADAVEQVELDKAVQKGKERRAPRS